MTKENCELVLWRAQHCYRLSCLRDFARNVPNLEMCDYEFENLTPKTLHLDSTNKRILVCIIRDTSLNPELWLRRHHNNWEKSFITRKPKMGVYSSLFSIRKSLLRWTSLPNRPRKPIPIKIIRSVWGNNNYG